MEQGDQRRLFNAKPRRDLGLSQLFGGDGQMQKCSPFGLAQTHWLEPLVQFQSPGPSSAVEQRTKSFIVESRRGKIVSILPFGSPFPGVKPPSSIVPTTCRPPQKGSPAIACSPESTI